MAMALSDALRLPKARIIIFLSCIFLLFFLLGCDRAAEDAYGKTYGINITSPAEQKSPPSATDLHDYSTAEIAQALEGMTEGNAVVLIMRINKGNLIVRSVIAKDKSFNERPITANVYFYQLLDESGTGLFVGGIRGLEYAYNPDLDGEQSIPDPAGLDKIVSSDVSFTVDFPYYKNATILRLLRMENDSFATVGEVLLK